MFRDASVNTGAASWTGSDAGRGRGTKDADQVAPLGGRRCLPPVRRLFNLVYDPAFLVHAWQRVASNAGARTPGVDRATVAWIESTVGVPSFLGQLRDSLKSGEFAPVEVRQALIPKARGKLRAKVAGWSAPVIAAQEKPRRNR
jgi:RNA-directed DNA polymerase